MVKVELIHQLGEEASDELFVDLVAQLGVALTTSKITVGNSVTFYFHP